MAKTDDGQAQEVVTGELVPLGGDGGEIEPFVNENGEVLIAGPAAARLRQLLETVPVDDENGSERIAEMLMDATSVVDLNKPWDATGGRTLAGRQLRINKISGRPSRFPGGLRAFLVAECTDISNGEAVVMTTSAMAVVVQLARVNAEGWLPAFATVEVADRPTEKGYYPYHLRFFASAMDVSR